MKLLYDRVCKINLNGKEIEYTHEIPVSIEFNKDFQKGKPSITKVKIYNTSKDTISLCEPKGKEFPECTIEAGYKDINGIVTLGEVFEFKVDYRRPDRILEFSVTDKTTKWSNAIINQTYKGSVKNIISQMANKIGLKLNEIDIDDVDVPSFTATNFKQSMDNILKKVNAVFYFQDGRLSIEKINSNKTKKVVYLSNESGLIGSPSKKISTDKKTKGKVTWTVKSLFMSQFGLGVHCKINSNELKDVELEIVGGKHSFSTFGSATTEIEGVIV